MSNAVLENREPPVSETIETALPCYVPAVEVLQDDDSIVLIAEMPGVDEKSVDITLENGSLTIEGIASRGSFDGYTLVRSEAPAGTYKRTFKIVEEIDADCVNASIKNGVLTLTLPIHEKAKPRTIQVRAE